MSKKMRKKTLERPAKTAIGKAPKARSAASVKKPAAKKRLAAPKPAPLAGKPKTVAKTTSKTATKTAAKTATRPAAKTVAKAAAPKAAPAKPKPVAAKAGAAGSPGPAGGRVALAEGAKAPVFHLPRDGGATVSLADFAGRKLVLFFYPRADTPSCTREAIDFTRLAGAFADAGTAVLGVSADPLKAQEAFRDKHELGLPLMSDEKHEILEAYGVWGEKSMYGKTFLGVLRTTVLIGPTGRIIKIWRQVKVEGHAEEVLAAAQAA